MQSRTDTRTHFKDLGDTADVTNHRSVLLHENDSFLRTVLRIKLKPSAKRSMRTISCCVLDYLVYFIVYISNDGANTDKLLDTYFFYILTAFIVIIAVMIISQTQPSSTKSSTLARYLVRLLELGESNLAATLSETVNSFSQQ